MCVCVKVGTGRCQLLVLVPGLQSLASGHPESQLLPVSPGQALPLPALSHNTFISRPSSSSPQHTTSVISTSSPTSQAHSPPDLGYQGQKDCGVQVILSCSLQILVFVTLPGPIQKKIFESEPSNQGEVKLFMVEDKNFMAPIMINYCLILNIIRGNGFNFIIFLSVLLLNSIKKEPVALSDF